jgi:threonine/homoserine/homoserine lactone efflux protein
MASWSTLFGVGFGGKVILVAVNGVFGYPAVLTWAAFGMGLRKIFSSPEKARILNGALGLSLVIVAIWVALPH